MLSEYNVLLQNARTFSFTSFIVLSFHLYGPSLSITHLVCWSLCPAWAPLIKRWSLMTNIPMQERFLSERDCSMEQWWGSRQPKKTDPNPNYDGPCELWMYVQERNRLAWTSIDKMKRLKARLKEITSTCTKGISRYRKYENEQMETHKLGDEEDFRNRAEDLASWGKSFVFSCGGHSPNFWMCVWFLLEWDM